MDEAPGRVVRLAEDVLSRLEQLAHRRRISADELARLAVADYLDRADRREVLLRETLDALAEHEATGLHLTDSEADDWLARLEAGGNAEPPPLHI